MTFRIKDLIREVSRGENFRFCSSVFLDGFYGAATPEARLALIQDEPETFDNVGHFFYCDVAAISHKLANDYDLPVPEWVHKPEYVLPKPHYDLFDTKNEALRRYLEEVSPHEFKIRNIFVNKNCLDRV
ncbi:hypothetical protein [Paenibacillus dendritiformis]|uniref:hypothetical protein n=1 Tax=Paenibacillus dendritiformis TaxID=130049 RepID=UPI000DA8E2C3|nr:hypothetical protein [Paenibacillus dendritiformis]PZM66016.1 hypothetical protein DOE73_08755 [Paenibacillus dendritiformis]